MREEGRGFIKECQEIIAARMPSIISPRIKNGPRLCGSVIGEGWFAY